ncbi:hypothetical protein H4R24_000647 [Coemansia sp. RSA 988]|nr:hypothetical protein H4R24_000647 [Coemansia sp. RSA 988]
MRKQYRELRKCESLQTLDALWGDILVQRLSLQDLCEQLILRHPNAANTVAADRYLWRIVYYDAIVECRKRLRLHVPLHNLSHASSIADSSGRNSEINSISDGAPLEEWEREWWMVTLTTLFNEALGYFQSLLDQLTQQLEHSSLAYSINYITDAQYRLPDAFRLTRRTYVYIGDIYRYQYMYLPLLTYSDIGPTDTDSILELARWTYARARAMFVDSGRACTQLALLSAYAHNRFEAVYWQVCGLGYARESLRKRARGSLLYVPTPDGSNNDYEDIMEESVIKFAYALLNGSNEANVEKAYLSALEVLEEDLYEVRASEALVNLDGDFWTREYQLCVILAALFTAVSHSLDITGEELEIFRGWIQHLALVLLLRHITYLHQVLEMNGQNDAKTAVGIIYPLISIALWVDIWRSGALSSFSGHQKNHHFPAALRQHSAELFECLIQLHRKHAPDIALSRGAERNETVASILLPHDVSLMGWATLRKTQQDLRYNLLGNILSPHKMSNLDNTLRMPQNIDTTLMEFWQNASSIMQVVFSRVQLVVFAIAELPDSTLISWDYSGELLIGAPKPKTNGVRSEFIPNAPTTLRIPDESTWRDYLPMLQKWILNRTCTLVLADIVQHNLISSSDHKTRAALRFIEGETKRQSFTLLRADGLDCWDDANAYLCGLAEIVDDGLADVDEDLPTAVDVPDHMRGLLSCALLLAHVRFLDCSVAIVTDDEELEFYASWFGIRTIRPAETLDEATDVVLDNAISSINITDVTDS